MDFKTLPAGDNTEIGERGEMFTKTRPVAELLTTLLQPTITYYFYRNQP